MSSRFKKFYPILLIILVVILSVSLLVASETVTRAVLESRQDQETLELLQGIFPEASFYTSEEDTEIYTLYNNGRNEIDFAFYGSSWGFNFYITVIFINNSIADTQAQAEIFGLSFFRGVEWEEYVVGVFICYTEAGISKSY